MDNLKIYNATRTVPDAAIKEIKGGRLKGMSDINPMWRIKTLTEQFGICGIGWKYEIVKTWMETGGKGEIAAFCQINLYVKVDGAWSDPIPGTGGSMFVSEESKGLYTSDECYKMALTDAISVACKALGFGADVYWDKDKTKYDKPEPAEPPKIVKQTATEKTLDTLNLEIARVGWNVKECLKYALDKFKREIPDIQSLTENEANFLIAMLQKRPDKQ